MSIKAVVFDAFGTLVRIADDRSRPYLRLLKALESEFGRVSNGVADRRWIMTTNVPFEDVPAKLGFPNPSNMNILLHDLEREKTSITLYNDVIEGLSSLHKQGIKIGVCSNLATPYCEPVRQQLCGIVTRYTMSCEVGFIKPDPEIYNRARIKVDLNDAKDILFVGDSYSMDVEGPQTYGMDAIYLQRVKKHPFRAFDRVPRDITYVSEYVRYHNIHNA